YADVHDDVLIRRAWTLGRWLTAIPHTSSDAVNTDRSAQGCRNALEVVGIARDHEIPAGKRSVRRQRRERQNAHTRLRTPVRAFRRDPRLDSLSVGEIVAPEDHRAMTEPERQ